MRGQFLFWMSKIVLQKARSSCEPGQACYEQSVEQMQCSIVFVKQDEAVFSFGSPDAYGMILLLLKNKRMVGIKTTEQSGNFLLYLRDVGPVAIKRLTDRQVKPVRATHFRPACAIGAEECGLLR